MSSRGNINFNYKQLHFNSKGSSNFKGLKCSATNQQVISVTNCFCHCRFNWEAFISLHDLFSILVLTGILTLPIITGAHVRQPEHRGVRVGAASGGSSQEDWRGAVVGAVWSEHLQVSFIHSAFIVTFCQQFIALCVLRERRRVQV